MRSKNKYNDLARLLDQLNSGQKKPEKENLSEEEDKLICFWEKNTPPEYPISGIIEKTNNKIKQAGKKKKNFSLLRATSIAASLLILIASGIYFYTSDNTDQYTDLLTIAASLNQDSESMEEVTIITSDSQFNVTNDALIRYSDDGMIEVGSDVVEETISKRTAAPPPPPPITIPQKIEEEYNHLIVPKGKRARLLLSDGSSLWVNSLSKVVYPRTFTGDTRSIYAQGEVYLEVAHDAERPFHVISDNFKLKVLGTRFNISNYHGDDQTSIVLVDGSIEITDNYDKNYCMSPSDLLTIRDGMISDIRKVDPRDYISWINGLLILKGENLQAITHRLSIYFGIDIYCEATLKNEKVYGKLDLKDSLTEILSTIRDIIPLKIEETEQYIRLTR